MRHISRYRNHKAVAPLLLIIALFGIGTTFNVASASIKEPMNASARSAQIEEGKQIFLKGCSTCHGLNLEGSAIAPALMGVGAASVDFQVGTGRMPVADMSAQIARKEPVYNEEEVAALAAYVASLAPGPAIPTDEQLNYERDGSTAEGGELFRNNCAMCHNFAGQGITGPQSMPVFNDKTLTPEEKLSVIKWIKAAEAEPNLGGASLGRTGPVAEGLLVWILGLGVLIAVAVWLTSRAR